MKDLEGRVALVTGGAQGIGAASARALAEAGARVLVTDVGDGEAVAKEIGGAFLSHDVTDEAQWAAAVAHAKQTFGGLDILVNNAGVFWRAPIVATELEAFRHMQKINVEGVFLGMKHAIPALAERAAKWDGGGAIVNISSVAGIVGSPLTLAYNASKGAVRLMTKTAAIECGRGGMKIRANSVHPGVIETAMAEAVIGSVASAGGEGSNSARERVVALHPLGRLGRASDVANAVKFLASDAAAFVTGSELVVDGGMTAN